MNMKRLILALCILSLLFSCKKSSSVLSVQTGLVSSNTSYFTASQGRVVTTLQYNAAQQIAHFSWYEYDTSGGVANQDSVGYDFAINTTTNLPSSYTMTGWESSLSNSYVETHDLFYDGQGRLVKDTAITGQNNPGDSAANYFSYTANRIIVREYSMYAYDTVNLTTGWGCTTVDTINLVNGNIVDQEEYDQNGADWILNYSYTINGFSNYANPLYNQNFSNSIAALFLDANLMDCLSKNLTSDDGVHWITDPSGKVISGSAPTGETAVYTYY
jgi:hypothetical protein